MADVTNQRTCNLALGLVGALQMAEVPGLTDELQRLRHGGV